MFFPWVGKISWRREWLPTPVFLPGESHEQRSLEGYSPQGRRESDIAEQLSKHSLVTGFRRVLESPQVYRELQTSTLVSVLLGTTSRSSQPTAHTSHYQTD